MRPGREIVLFVLIFFVSNVFLAGFFSTVGFFLESAKKFFPELCCPRSLSASLRPESVALPGPRPGSPPALRRVPTENRPLGNWCRRDSGGGGIPPGLLEPLPSPFSPAGCFRGAPPGSGGKFRKMADLFPHFPDLFPPSPEKMSNGAHRRPGFEHPRIRVCPRRSRGGEGDRPEHFRARVDGNFLSRGRS